MFGFSWKSHNYFQEAVKGDDKAWRQDSAHYTLVVTGSLSSVCSYVLPTSLTGNLPVRQNSFLQNRSKLLQDGCIHTHVWHITLTFATRSPKISCNFNWIFLLCRYKVVLSKTGISNSYYQKFLSKKNVLKKGLTVQLNRRGLDWWSWFTFSYMFKMEIGQCKLLQNTFLRSMQNIKPPFIFPGYFSFWSQQCLPMTYHGVLCILWYLYHTLAAFDIPKFMRVYASTVNRHLGNSFTSKQLSKKNTHILEVCYLSILFKRASQIYLGCYYIVIDVYL